MKNCVDRKYHVDVSVLLYVRYAVPHMNANVCIKADVANTSSSYLDEAWCGIDAVYVWYAVLTNSKYILVCETASHINDMCVDDGKVSHIEHESHKCFGRISIRSKSRLGNHTHVHVQCRKLTVGSNDSLHLMVSTIPMHDTSCELILNTAQPETNQVRTCRHEHGHEWSPHLV